jgi:hypothetical protein
VSRALAAVLGLVVVLGGIYGLSQAFTARDDPGVEPSGAATGLEPDRGAEHGARAGAVEGEPPTSGPHREELVTADARELSADQILHALELGDVVVAYPQARPPAALRALQTDVAGPFDPELAAAGQAVVLARVPGLDGVQALAWRRRLRSADPGDPALATFAERRLGQGLDGAR